jgi:Spy/CpxP family protein refolding chaperone
MKIRFLRIACIGLCLVAATAAGAFAQGRGGPGGGGPPPGGGGPGGPGGPGGSVGPGGFGTQPPPSMTGSPRTNSPAHGALQLGPVGRWWDDKSVAQTVGIRKEQQKKMDAIFGANKQAILDSYKIFLSEQAKLDALSKNPKADQAKLFAAIDAVSQARAGLQKATTQMLLQVRQQMDPDQIAKLEKLR